MEPTVISPSSQPSNVAPPDSPPPPTPPSPQGYNQSGIVAGVDNKRAGHSINKWFMIAAFVLVFGGIGSWLLFSSHADDLVGNGPIYYSGAFSINSDGTNKVAQPAALKQLSDYNWSFSPNGNQVAAVTPSTTSTTGDDRNIVIANADGTDQHTILSNIPVIGYDVPKIAWSPDGQWLAFGIGVESGNGANQPAAPYAIAIVHPDGSDYHQIPNISFGEYDEFGGSVSWSPDSQTLVYTTDNGLCTTNLTGQGNCVSLSDPVSGYAFYAPEVSPDGTKVLLTTISSQATDSENDVWTAYDIYEVNIDGSDLQNLTNSPQATVGESEDASYATWSPDGSLIAYGITGTGTSLSALTGLYVMNSDGTNAHRIDTAQAYAISWQRNQPTNPVATTYQNGTVYYGTNFTLTADGKGTGYGLNPAEDAFSWTGQQFANIANYSTGTKIEVSNVNDPSGATPKSYTLASTDVRDIAWTHNPVANGSGQKIAFVDGGTDDEVGTTQLGSIDLTSGTPTLYTVTNNASGTGLSSPKIYSQYAQVVGVDWSQDNSQIYYAIYDGNTSVETTLTFCTYTISSQTADCDGSTQIPLEGPTNGDSSTDLSQVVWSPDGGRIAYEYKGAVFVANRDGSAPIQVSSFTSGTTYYSKVIWTPDGQNLLYTLQVNGKSQVNEVNIASKSTTVFSTLSADPNASDETGWLLEQPLPTSVVITDKTIPKIINFTVDPDSYGAAGPASSQWIVPVCFDATDNVAVAKVNIYDNGKLINTVAGSSNNLNTCSNIPASSFVNGPNSVTVTAYDFSGNASGTATLAKGGSSTFNRGYLYKAVTPTRIASTTIAAAKTFNVQVGGAGGVPKTGVGAVVLHVTEASASASNYLTVYPTGQARPGTSVLNGISGKVADNQTISALGTNGQVTVYNSAGNTKLYVDVVGYYSLTGNTFNPVTATRIADTRTGSGKPDAGKTLAAKGTLNVQVTGLGGVPTNATNALVEVSNVNSKATGSLVVYGAGATRPSLANLTYSTTGLTKELIVPLGTNPAGAIAIYNGGASSTDVIVNVIGYYSPSTTGLSYVPLTTQKRAISDEMITAGATIMPYALPTNAGVPQPAANAGDLTMVGNFTVLSNATSNTSVTVFAAGGTKPSVTTVNGVKGVITYSEVTIPPTKTPGSGPSFELVNGTGTAYYNYDAIGYFY